MPIKTVEFFLFDTVLALDFTGPMDVFFVATRLLHAKGMIDEGYHFLFSAEEAGLITLESGLRVMAEKAISKGPSLHTLVVPGGQDVEFISNNKPLMQRLHDRAVTANRLVSVCNGARILASAGLLKGKTCSTHWLSVEKLSYDFPDITVKRDSLFTKDGNIYTSAGVTSGIDLFLSLVEEDYGPDLALETARYMVLYRQRPGDQSQFSTPLNYREKAGQKYAHLHDWIITNLTSPLQVDTLADKMGMSARNFYRDFTKYTGSSPGKYVEELRIEKARELLETTTLATGTVAEMSGFQREERLRRVFIRAMGITPGQYRLHFTRKAAFG